MAIKPVSELSNFELLQEMLKNHTFLEMFNNTGLVDGGNVPIRVIELIDDLEDQLVVELNKRLPLDGS